MALIALLAFYRNALIGIIRDECSNYKLFSPRTPDVTVRAVLRSPCFFSCLHFFFLVSFSFRFLFLRRRSLY